MKKTIDTIIYDTEEAKKIASWDNNRIPSDLEARAETLYVTTNGTYFRTALGFDTNGSRISIITPLTDAEALDWCEKYDCNDAAKEHFSHLITEA